MSDIQYLRDIIIKIRKEGLEKYNTYNRSRGSGKKWAGSTMKKGNTGYVDRCIKISVEIDFISRSIQCTVSGVN